MNLILTRDPNLGRRRRKEQVARGLLLSASLACIAMLAWLLVRLTTDGFDVLMRASFWTNVHDPLGIRRGTSGILDAVYASLTVLVVTMAIAVPVGTAAGIYLHEYAPKNKLTSALRATIHNLAGVPSVVYGLLGLAVFVRMWLGDPNMLAAGLTLAALILPLLVVSTEEALKTVPQAIRDASLAMGATKWQTIRGHVLPYSLPGILTGNILALSRAAGESAPLLIIGLPVFTTMIGFSPLDPGTPLQVRVYYLAQDARAAAIDLAAGAIVVLLVATLVLNLGAILIRERLSRRIRW